MRVIRGDQKLEITRGGRLCHVIAKKKRAIGSGGGFGESWKRKCGMGDGGYGMSLTSGGDGKRDDMDIERGGWRIALQNRFSRTVVLLISGQW